MKKVVGIVVIFIVLLTSTIAFATSDGRVSLGYLYNASESHTQIVNHADGNLNTVSPTCFDLTDDGHLFINNIFSQEFVEEMHAQNIAVTPFLSNHWSKGKAQAALKNKEQLVDEIVEALVEHHLDGVNIDLENLNVKQKEDLTAFVKLLREKMPKEMVLSVAVAANPNELTSTWVAAYDYQALAEQADYLVLMAYDEHSQGGAEGPVASLSFVEESIKVVLKDVSRDKVVLGMPLYGRFWESGEESGGEAMINAQIERIASRYKTFIPRYDKFTGTATLTITVESGEKKAYVNGRYLEEGTYTIWYENQDSYLKKLQLMNDYGLKGAALWAIGNEANGFWNTYAKGFASEEYESEQNIKERIYYEQIERIRQEVDPLQLTKDLKVKGELAEVLKEKLTSHAAPMLEEKVHLPEEPKENEKPSFLEEKVILKEKNFKILERFEIVHLIKRIG